MTTPNDRPSGPEPDHLTEEDLRLLRLLQRIQASLSTDSPEKVIPFPERAAQPPTTVSNRSLLTRLLKGLRDDDGDEDDEQPRQAA